MLKISKLANINNNVYLQNENHKKQNVNINTCHATNPQNVAKANGINYQAYHPSFHSTTNNTKTAEKQQQYKKIISLLDNKTKTAFNNLKTNGILDNNNSNDGSSVLDNLYKITTDPRIKGLKKSVILKEVINALNNPSSITQKFGDIPPEVVSHIERTTGKPLPANANNVISSCCVVASMEYNLASKMPAEFARFANELSGETYSVTKNIKLSDLAKETTYSIWLLNKFKADKSIKSNWEDLSVTIKPDRNAIVRARVQTSFKDPGERSCVDVLIQSALLNLGSQNTYDALIDERTGELNPDNTGLTDFEKNFVEEIVFGVPKIPITYQNLDENGYLVGYNCEPDETKQHILKSLQMGQNVIIGYTHFNANNQVDGGHEITIIGYKQTEDGKNYFICNDTDDNIDEPIFIEENKLIPLIHHAGISKEALSEKDVIVEPWREIVNQYQAIVKQSMQNNK